MVPGDQQNRNAELTQAGEQPIQQFYRSGGGSAPVIDVAGDDDRVRPGPGGKGQEALDPVGLIAGFQQIDAVKGFSEMQVREMKKTHRNHRPQTFL